MKKLAGSFRSFLTDEDGATMVEYGMMVALIAAVCAVIVGILGGQINTAFTNVSNAITAA